MQNSPVFVLKRTFGFELAVGAEKLLFLTPLHVGETHNTWYCEVLIHLPIILNMFQVMYLYYLLGWKVVTKYFRRWEKGEDQAELKRELQVG